MTIIKKLEKIELGLGSDPLKGSGGHGKETYSKGPAIVEKTQGSSK